MSCHGKHQYIMVVTAQDATLNVLPVIKMSLLCRDRLISISATKMLLVLQTMSFPS